MTSLHFGKKNNFIRLHSNLQKYQNLFSLYKSSNKASSKNSIPSTEGKEEKKNDTFISKVTQCKRIEVRKDKVLSSISYIRKLNDNINKTETTIYRTYMQNKLTNEKKHRIESRKKNSILLYTKENRSSHTSPFSRSPVHKLSFSFIRTTENIHKKTIHPFIKYNNLFNSCENNEPLSSNTSFNRTPQKNISPLHKSLPFSNQKKNVHHSIEVHRKVYDRNETRTKSSTITPKSERKETIHLIKVNRNDHLGRNSISSMNSAFNQNQNMHNNNNSIDNNTSITKFKRIINFYEETHVGFDGNKTRRINQDACFIYHNFANNTNYKLFSVCDGHGDDGHKISKLIKSLLPQTLSRNLKTENLYHYNKDIESIIKDTFESVSSSINSNKKVNTLSSGSTSINVLFTENQMICMNIGDSRAILVKCSDNNWTYKQLSRDHKPDTKGERERIIEMGGSIHSVYDKGKEVGPLRVWVKGKDIPGLGMSRSIGDKIAHTVGVISEPEITVHDLVKEDKCLLIASDGVWEYMTNKDCIDIIQKYYDKKDITGCANEIYQESKKKWIKEEAAIDDITVILVFLD